MPLSPAFTSQWENGPIAWPKQNIIVLAQINIYKYTLPKTKTNMSPLKIGWIRTRKFIQPSILGVNSLLVPGRVSDGKTPSTHSVLIDFSQLFSHQPNATALICLYIKIETKKNKL